MSYQDRCLEIKLVLIYSKHLTILALRSGDRIGLLLLAIEQDEKFLFLFSWYGFRLLTRRLPKFVGMLIMINVVT